MSYADALAHPFSPTATGAQVPDLYSFPTQTNTVRQIFTVSSTTSDVDFVVQPNLLATIAAGYGGTGSSTITGGNLWFQSNDADGFTELGLCTMGQLSQLYARYRLVGFGVRIKSLIPPLNQQGRLIAAKVPSLTHMAVYSSGEADGFSPNGVPLSITPNATWTDYLNFYELPGVDATGYMSNSMLSLPSAHENSVSGLSLDNGLEVVGSISSADAFKWRDAQCDSVISAADPVTYAPTYQTGQVQSYVGAGGFPIQVILDEDFVQLGGWSVLCFRASGLPNAGTSQAYFDVEIVAHIEGVPFIGSSAIVTSNKHPPVNPGLLNHAVSMAHSLPPFRKIKHYVRQADHFTRSMGLGSASHALSSLALGLL